MADFWHPTRAANRRLLDTERVGQGCVLASPAFERIAHPSTTVDGRRAPALRFGDPRVQALAGALSVSLLAVTGITNKSLRALMTGLLGESYPMSRASYDLTRLRRNGLIARVKGRNLYRLTDDGLAFAIFYTKVHNRVLRPLLATDRPQAHHRYAPPCAPSTATSTLNSPRPGYRRRLPDTLDKCQSPSDQGSLEHSWQRERRARQRRTRRSGVAWLPSNAAAGVRGGHDRHTDRCDDHLDQEFQPVDAARLRRDAESACDERADERGHDADDDRQPDRDGLPARHDQPTKRADDGTDDNRGNDSRDGHGVLQYCPGGR